MCQPYIESVMAVNENSLGIVSVSSVQASDIMTITKPHFFGPQAT